MSNKNSNVASWAKKIQAQEAAPKTKRKVELAADNADIPEIIPVQKKAGTFRISIKSHRLIALALNEARRNGEKGSKDSIVDEAIQKMYGHLDEK